MGIVIGMEIKLIACNGEFLGIRAVVAHSVLSQVDVFQHHSAFPAAVGDPGFISPAGVPGRKYQFIFIYDKIMWK